MLQSHRRCPLAHSYTLHPLHKITLLALLRLPLLHNRRSNRYRRDLLLLIILLIETNAQRRNQREINARRDLHAVRLLAEE